MPEYQNKLLHWYRQNRRDLPWRNTHDPYRIWLSEIMLQQTRVDTVKGYYARFLDALPDIASLAAAPEEQVLKLWEGLGYYSRARSLQRAAKQVMAEHNGIFPNTYEEILALPGIGPYTGGAIASIAFGVPVPAVDGNVYRVSTRLYGIRESVDAPAVQRMIREQLLSDLPQDVPGDFNQALMELGATLCSPQRPKCESCPLHGLCDAEKEGDAERLPFHEPPRPPRQVDMAVALCFYDGRVLMQPRSERLLKGLYVFCLYEDEQYADRVRERLVEDGLEACFVSDLGEAKHVFTHRVWNMRLYRFDLTEPPTVWLDAHGGALLADADTLCNLPVPTAMAAAKAAALREMGGANGIPAAQAKKQKRK